MEPIVMEKKLVIKYDMVKGEFWFENNDDMTYAELLSALEYAKFLIMKDWLRGED